MKFDDSYIQRYLDGDLSAIEEKQFLEEIANNEGLEQRLNAYLLVDETIKDSISEATVSTAFVHNVYSNLDKIEVKKKPFWNSGRLFITFVIVISIVAGFILLSSNVEFNQLLPTISTETPTIKELNIDINPNTYINEDLLFKVMIYLNAILALFLLDRAILRPLLRQKKSNFSV